MKSFASWGIRIKKELNNNYYSIWNNLKTIRMDLGEVKPIEYKEFFDIGITEKCNAACDFCYVNARSNKEHYTNICNIWKDYINTLPKDTICDLDTDSVLQDILTCKTNTIYEKQLQCQFRIAKLTGKSILYTYKPFQVAIGSVGEPTIHPEFCRFLETVYNTGVVPNYTTNGLYMTSKILEYTRNYCGGVAVSYGNKLLRNNADETINKLLLHSYCKVMIHHIISDNTSVDEFINACNKWGNDISYHVLLPLMAHGRSNNAMTYKTYLYLINEIKKYNITNIAFGANFLPFMKITPINVWEYPQEVYSCNLLLKDNRIIFTPSSFNLNESKRLKRNSTED